MEPGFKKCTKCGEEKERAYFYKRKDANDGYRDRCKECYQITAKKWRTSNKEKVVSYGRKWKSLNKEKATEGIKKWKLVNKKRIKETNASWYLANLNRKRQTSKLWRRANLEKALALSRAWNYKNKEKKKENDHKWIQNNPDKRKKYKNTYIKKKCLLDSSFKLQLGLRRYVTLILKPDILKRDNYSCLLCNTNNVFLIVHHILPAAKNPLLVEEKDNLASLCKQCHKIAHINNWRDIDPIVAKKLTFLVIENTMGTLGCS